MKICTGWCFEPIDISTRSYKGVEILTPRFCALEMRQERTKISLLLYFIFQILLTSYKLKLTSIVTSKFIVKVIILQSRKQLILLNPSETKEIKLKIAWVINCYELHFKDSWIFSKPCGAQLKIKLKVLSQIEFKYFFIIKIFIFIINNLKTRFHSNIYIYRDFYS